jgi:hypothetical protein
VYHRSWKPDLQVPVLVRGGAIVAQLPYTQAIQHGSASKAFDALQFLVYPAGPAARQSFVYEDDGMSNKYLSGQYTNTSFSYVLGASCASFNASLTGSFPFMPSYRSLALWWLQSPVPTSVTANGVSVPSSPTDGQPGTWFRSRSGDTHVTLQSTPSNPDLSVSVCH